MAYIFAYGVCGVLCVASENTVILSLNLYSNTEGVLYLAVSELDGS